jgi:hypothetical protein
LPCNIETLGHQKLTTAEKVEMTTEEPDNENGSSDTKIPVEIFDDTNITAEKCDPPRTTLKRV